jgi:integrase/recombinase XerD
VLTKNEPNLLTKFFQSRRQGLSPRTIEYYRHTIEPYLQYCNNEITPLTINSFLASLNCSTGGKHAYYRGIGVFINFLVRHDYLQDNPLKKVDAPKPPKPILPSLTLEQVQYLIDEAECLRDRSIISLLADSGMRLREVSNIRYCDVDWEN